MVPSLDGYALKGPSVSPQEPHPEMNGSPVASIASAENPLSGSSFAPRCFARSRIVMGIRLPCAQFLAQYEQVHRGFQARIRYTDILLRSNATIEHFVTLVIF